MANISRIMKKKKWTGADLGKLELTNMAVLYQQDKDREPEKPIVEADRMREMLSSVTDPKQKAIYREYISIHNWIINEHSMAQTQLEQAYYKEQVAYTIILQATMAEEAQRYIEQLPSIMTEKQYDDLKAENMESYFTDEEGKDIYCDVFSLLCRATSYFHNQLIYHSRKKNPLKAIRKQYENEPVKSELILSQWADVCRNGYYILPDGRKSDDLKTKDWKDLYGKPEFRELLSKYVVRNDDGTRLSDDNIIEIMSIGGKLDFSSVTGDDPAPFEWHKKETASPTKWEIISGEYLKLLYPAPVCGDDPYSPESFTASMEDLEKEFPELVSVILAEIDKSFFKGKESLSELPVNEWQERKYSLRKLYTEGFYGVREEAEGDKGIFLDDNKAVYNGVAIVRACDTLTVENCHSITSDNKYKEPQPTGFISRLRLDSENFPGYAESFISSEKILLESYYFLTGYNYAIEQIAKIHDVPELNSLKFDLTGLDKKIDLLNSAFPYMQKVIAYTDYSDNKAKAKKLKILTTYLKPLEYKNMEIPEENRQEIIGAISDFSAFHEGKRGHIEDLLYELPAIYKEQFTYEW